MINEYHIVRTSERLRRRVCLRSWDLQRQGWRPIIGPQALEFGTGFHAGKQAIYEPATWNSTTPEQKLESAIDAFVACCEEQRRRYLLATSQTRLTWDGRDDYANRIELGKRMLEYYIRRVHPIEDRGLRPVRVETKFQVPLREADGSQLRCFNSPTCGQAHSNGAPVKHEGRVDVIFQDTEHGGYIIGDWKTVGGDKAVDGKEKNTSRFSDPSTVWSHDQLSFYSAALRVELNLDIRGFILMESRKDYPKPPAPLKHRRNGCAYSTDKNMATDLDTYKDHVRKHDNEGYISGAYKDYLEYLASEDAPRYHQRVRVAKTKRELELVIVNVTGEVKEMLRPDGRIYPEPSKLACPWCAFKSPCEMMSRGMDYMFTLNANFHRETIE